MRAIITFILVFSAFNILVGQNIISPKELIGKKGEIVLKNKHIITSYKFLEVANDSIEYEKYSIEYTKYSNSKSKTQISIEDIDFVKIRSKSRFKVIQGTLVGILPGIILTQLHLSALESGGIQGQRYKDEAKRKYRPVIIIGGIIGGLIGLDRSKMRKYYISKETGMIKSIEPDVYLGLNSIGLTLKVNLDKR